MKRLLAPRKFLTIVALTAAWCGLWNDLSPANVLSGSIIAVAVTSIGVGTPGKGRIRLRPLLHLAWLVLVDLVKSTASVAAEIVTPTDRTDEAIVAVNVPAPSRDHFLLLIVSITLTPGTAVVDADPDSGTLYLHLLHHNRLQETVSHVQTIARLACEALPVEPDSAPSHDHTRTGHGS